MKIVNVTAVVVVLGCLSGACGQGHGDGDAQIPRGDAVDAADSELGMEARQEEVSGDTGDLADATAPAGLRAFVIQDVADLLPGRDAVGRIGDLRIENGRISAVIGAADHAIWGPYGGGVLDFTAAGGEDYFEEQFPIAGFLRGVRVESIEVVSDGSNGEALIRVQGRDGPIPLVASVIPLPPAGIEVTVEYALQADSDCLEVRTSVTNGSDASIEVPVGDGIVFSESGRTFGSGAGFDTDALVGQGEVAFLGADLSTVSYLMAPHPSGHMTLALLQEELNAVLYDSLSLAPGKSGTVKRRLYAAAGRSIHVLDHYWEDRGKTLLDLQGAVAVKTPGYDFLQLAVEIRREGEFFGAAGPDANGALQFRLPAGSYSGVVAGPGVEPMDVLWDLGPDGQAEPLEIDPVDPGRIDVEVVDPDNAAVPARIMAQVGSDAAFGAARVALVPDVQGQATLFLPAGDYTVQGSHGPEWTYCRESVAVAAGEAVPVTCQIEREVDVSGWIQGDCHTHSEYSIDSHLLREERVRVDVAEGLAFWASTDHDVFTDFSSVIAAVGAEGLILSSVGNEVSPVGRHFNALGCSPPPEKMYKYFAVPWVGFDEEGEVTGFLPAPAVWKSMHEDFGCRVVQINHPRDGQGYFDFVHYDPTVGPSSATPGQLDLTFDAIEVWNSGDDWDHLESLTLVDWYSFLNRGHLKVATGNSDTHELEQWAGQPRNLVQVDGELTEEGFYDSLLAFRGQVTSAPFIEFQIDGQGLGSTVVPASPDAAVSVRIRVSAPSWAPLALVQLVGNGVVVQEWDVAAESGVERLDATVEVNPDADTWYHVRAFDPSGDLAPVYPGRMSAAFTNPIWVDLAGDGFDPLIKEDSDEMP